jgi:type 1 glutamine amidotransferase
MIQSAPQHSSPAGRRERSSSRRGILARAALSLLGLVGATFLTAPSSGAQPVIDCPLRDQPYSINSPLVDVLRKPEARAVLDRDAPEMLKKLPAAFAQPPTIATVLSLRMATFFVHLPDGALEKIDHDLEALPVTAADRSIRCDRYDVDLPKINMPEGKPRLLLFEKITGFRDGPSVEAARAALTDMAARHGWALVVTDKAGSMTPSTLKQFDVVIWNNVSGDVLTVTQRQAFKSYIEGGGGYVGIHGSGGDPVYYWDWYADTLIGARFAGHPMSPQFQDAKVIVVDDKSAIIRELAPGWTMKDEWYSFHTNPRASGAHVLAALDESSYVQKGMAGEDLHMGDHPIAWTKCIGNGRSFYSAIGHRPESYSEPHNVKLLEQAISWAAGAGETRCRKGEEAGSNSGR